MNKYMLGQKVIAGKYGYGLVTELGPLTKCGGRLDYKWVGVTPLVGSTWQMNFAPHNVRTTDVPFDDHIALWCARMGYAAWMARQTAENTPEI